MTLALQKKKNKKSAATTHKQVTIGKEFLGPFTEKELSLEFKTTIKIFVRPAPEIFIVFVCLAMRKL